MDCIYEFKDDGIYYTDKEKTMNFKWGIFKSYIVHHDYLIFSMNDTLESAYFLSKGQIGLDSFNNIQKIAATKLPMKTIR